MTLQEFAEKLVEVLGDISEKNGKAGRSITKGI